MAKKITKCIKVTPTEVLGLNIEDGGKYAILCVHGCNLIQDNDKNVLRLARRAVENACLEYCGQKPERDGGTTCCDATEEFFTV